MTKSGRNLFPALKSKKAEEEIGKFNLNNEYRVALEAQAEFVRLAAHYLLDFADVQPRGEYFRENYFLRHIETQKSDYSACANTVCEEVEGYWRLVITELKESHTTFLNVYKKLYPHKKDKQKIDFHGQPTPAQLNMVLTDIAQLLKLWPELKITKPSDLAVIKDLAELCIPVVNDTFIAHAKVAKIVNDSKALKEARRGRRLGVLGSLVSAAASAGQLALGLPPIAGLLTSKED